MSRFYLSRETYVVVNGVDCLGAFVAGAKLGKGETLKTRLLCVHLEFGPDS